MSAIALWGARCGAIALLAAAVAGCAGSGERIASMVTPYRPDVVQGNFVAREQVQALQPGMSRQQVREILGTPLVTDLFHANRWDYVFALRRPGVEPQMRRLTVFFAGDRFERVEGDEMPTEEEFVASLTSKVSNPKVPQLQASEEQLARFPKAGADAAAAAPPVAPAPGTQYPPLESASR